jgi:hypothetical protein
VGYFLVAFTGCDSVISTLAMTPIDKFTERITYQVQRIVEETGFDANTAALIAAAAITEYRLEQIAAGLEAAVHTLDYLAHMNQERRR